MKPALVSVLEGFEGVIRGEGKYGCLFGWDRGIHPTWFEKGVARWRDKDVIRIKAQQVEDVIFRTFPQICH